MSAIDPDITQAVDNIPYPTDALSDRIALGQLIKALSSTERPAPNPVEGLQVEMAELNPEMNFAQMFEFLVQVRQVLINFGLFVAPQSEKFESE